MNFFRNLILNLPATGPAATICTLAMCIAAVGITGDSGIGVREQF